MTNQLEKTNITSVMLEKEKTIEKIRQAALDEFYEKGYSKASLRNICKKAGVTTGAMYFSFENKEALFRSILDPLFLQYQELMAKYMGMELEAPEHGAELDVLMMKFILNHKKEALIVMEKAQGSCYESYRGQVEQMMEQSFTTFYQNALGTEPDSQLIKILARIRLDGCLEIIKGNYDMEYSLYLVEKIGIYANGGTGKLLQNLKELHSK